MIMDNDETPVELWYVYGYENHPDRERNFCGIFDSEEKAKEVAKALNESDDNKRAHGFRGTKFTYRYNSCILNSPWWDSI